MRVGRAAAMIVAASVAVAVVGSAVVPSAQARPALAHTVMVSVSHDTPTKASNENANEPSMSADGRFVVFSSRATNVGGLPTTGRSTQVYLRDVESGTTTVVSSASGAPGNGDSDRAVISGDGSTVVFVSEATNLAPFATSGIAQVLVWSRATGALIDASVSNDIPSAANRGTTGVAVSDDGSKVVFSSRATNLVGASTFGVFQVYSRDLKSRVTALESVDTRTPDTGASSDAMFPAISGDGRIVSFATAATLTPGDNTHSVYQVWVRDTVGGTLQLASVDGSGLAGFADSYNSTLSADGHLVAFASKAAGLTQHGVNGQSQIYLRDLTAKRTQLVSVDASDTSPGNAGSFLPDISPDGSAIAFQSGATNLIPESGGLPPGNVSRVFVRTLTDGRTAAACRAAADGSLCSSSSGSPSISADGTLVAFASDSPDVVPDIDNARAQAYLRDITETSRVGRIGGADRFEVSAATATDAFSTGVPVVYIASGATFADALSGSAAAGAGRGPVLLVTKDAIPVLVGIELHRLNPQRIVVLGGTASIDQNVERALAAYSPSVSRIGGADRYEVSAQISKSVFGTAGTRGGEHPPVYIASGETFPDALSGSAVAGSLGGPVLLVARDAIPATVATELKRLAPSKIVVLGGLNTISAGVVTGLGALASTTRIDGADRFAVSAAVSASSFAPGTRTVYVASGAVFPDALSGSAAAMQNRAPVLLVAPDQIPASVAAELRRLAPHRIVVLGGKNTVADGVLKALEGYLSTA